MVKNQEWLQIWRNLCAFLPPFTHRYGGYLGADQRAPIGDVQCARNGDGPTGLGHFTDGQGEDMPVQQRGLRAQGHQRRHGALWDPVFPAAPAAAAAAR